MGSPGLFSHLSLRYKIPLRVTALVLLVALTVTGAIVLRQMSQAREDLARSSMSLARALANTLQPYLRHDDVWRAYDIVVAASDDTDAPSPVASIIVTDAAGTVFVSSRPREFAVGSQLGSLAPEFAAFVAQRAAPDPHGAAAVAADAGDRLLYAAPILVDKVRLGDVILVVPRAALAPRYVAIIEQATAVTLLTLAVLLPASWFWAWRTGVPLVSLAAAMDKVPAQMDDIALDALPDSGDEIGHVTRKFRAMLADLKRKRELEEQVMASERLAAIGRLAAGIAHEINNPLGGMLNAISTYRKHGSDDPMANRTLALLERGLTQIRDTVGALLVETRLADRPLTRDDIEDALVLVAPEVERKRGRIERDIRFDQPMPLPARQVRQILLNLLLNAAHAIEHSGTIGLAVRKHHDALSIHVTNDGRHIPDEKMQYLFEPFTLAEGEGSGLGLWIVYQTVKQLGGELAVESRPGKTVFAIELPLEQAQTQRLERRTNEPATATVPD
jgi:signal transduction histidine kinase